ncbi:hypothetical protein LINPERHAP2_LOCUS34495 [Linum perenne]
MEMRRGIPLLCQQFTAPLKKNLLLSWRSPRATLSQLFAAFFSRPEVQQLRLLVCRRQGSRRGCSSAESSLRGQDALRRCSAFHAVVTYGLQTNSSRREKRLGSSSKLLLISLQAAATARLIIGGNEHDGFLRIYVLALVDRLGGNTSFHFCCCCSCKKSLPCHALRVSPLDSQLESVGSSFRFCL